MAESRPATTAVHALVRKASVYSFGFARSRSIRLAEEVAARAQVPLARRSLRTVHAERRSRGLGQST